MNEVTTQDQCLSFVEQLDQQLRLLAARLAEATFQRYLGLPHENPDVIQREQAEILLNVRSRDTVQKWLNKVNSVRLQRQLWLLNRQFTEAQVTLDPDIYTLRNALERTYSQDVPNLDGQQVTRGDLMQILQSHPGSREREHAWRALYGIGAGTHADLMRLFHLRGERAQKAGHANYAVFALFLNDINRDKIHELFQEILVATDSAWNVILDECRETLGIANLHPWDLVYFTEAKHNPLPESFFPRMSIIPSFRQLLRDLGSYNGDMPVRIEFKDIPFGGISFVVKYGQDIRVLVNPQDGHYWYHTIFHELGHAFHAGSIKEPSHIIAEGDPEFFREGIADAFASYVLDREWLTERFHLDDEEVSEFLRHRHAQQVYSLRRMVCDAMFELQLMEQAPAAAEDAYCELVSKYMGIEFPAGGYWAGDPIYAAYPLYLANYIVANAISAQIRKTLHSMYGSIVDRSVLGYMMENFMIAGGFVPWREKIIEATGEPLRSDNLLEELGAF